MNIKIEVIAHQEQRYPTVGDWTFNADGNLTIKVSALGDWKMEMLIALHELVEVLKCKHDGIDQAAVDAFDMEFEQLRERQKTGIASGEKIIGDSEPGDHPDAPYAKQHCLATGIERIMAAELGVSWSEYEKTIEALP